MECFVGVSTEKVLRITDYFSCTTPNIIFCIHCSNCNKLYISETGRRLGDASEITFTTCKNDQSKPVLRPFNSSNHSISDFVAFGLSVINGGNDESFRNRMEDHQQ